MLQTDNINSQELTSIFKDITDVIEKTQFKNINLNNKKAIIRNTFVPQYVQSKNNPIIPSRKILICYNLETKKLTTNADFYKTVFIAFVKFDGSNYDEAKENLIKSNRLFERSMSNKFKEYFPMNLNLEYFDDEEVEIIQEGMQKELDVSYYAKPCYDYEQMEEIFSGLVNGEDVKYFSNPKLDAYEMSVVRDAMKDYGSFEAYIEAQENELEKAMLYGTLALLEGE